MLASQEGLCSMEFALKLETIFLSETSEQGHYVAQCKTPEDILI
jgi:hypothetical protein